LPGARQGRAKTWPPPPAPPPRGGPGPRARGGGGPPACVQPRPTTCPSRTRTQPTLGFGQVRPRPRAASASAARMWPRSSACGFAASAGVAAELANELLEVLRLAEVAIHRGEADIRHLVECGERGHDDLA